MTTLLGLENIEHPGDLPQELRRVVRPGGAFLAISQFAAADGAAEERPHRRPALPAFAAAGWRVATLGARLARAEPTPKGRIIADTIDAFPTEPTTVLHCVLFAR